MNNDEFKKAWLLKYPDSHPISHSLKYKFKDRWFRIHYLPDSKRIPSNEEDFQLLLIRYNLLISDLIGEKEEYYLLISSFCGDDGFPLGYDDILDVNKFVGLEGLPLHEIEPDNYEEGEEYYLRIAVEKNYWKNNSLDKLLTAVAKDQISNLIIIGKDFECLLCPYEGGMDIILENEKIRNKYKHKYHSMASERVDGL